MVRYTEEHADILIIGAGGAGLFAALYADDQSPPGTDIRVVVKKLAGKSGCTRMVQGGYNAVLHPDDSVDSHFRDTVKGGKWINDQSLARLLVEEAPTVIRLLENELGVFFDRDENGHIHQKPFAGQSFDRTVHKGDLTGIEIMTKLRDELLTREVTFHEEVRAVDLLTRDETVVGSLVVDMRSGEFTAIAADATLLATGAGATMYTISTPALEKSADGQAMAYRRGATLQDMEMMQFHPTGLLAGDTKLTGGVIEEGIRGEGAHLYNGEDERFMARYAPDEMERATRDIVSRASYQEIMAGRGTPNGGVWLDATHLGKSFVEQTFPGMTERTRNVGQDLSEQRVEVSPTAHYHMGGVTINTDCRTDLPGLFVAGEDAGGAHGANRLGGNGVVDSTVLGKQAGIAMARAVEDTTTPTNRYEPAQVESIIRRVTAPLDRDDGPDIYDLREDLERVMWEKVGVVRTGEELAEAVETIDEIRAALSRVAVAGSRRYNLAWHAYMDLENLATVARLIAVSARRRDESRGAHYRADHPARDDEHWLRNVFVRNGGEDTRLWVEPVSYSYLSPDSTLPEG